MDSRPELEEMIEETPSEKLLDFLLHGGCSAGIFNTALEIFNPPFSLEVLVDKAKSFLQEEWENFKKAFSELSVDLHGFQFVHVSDVGGTVAEKKKVRRKLKSMAIDPFLMQENAMCPLHLCKCSLVHFHLSFLLHLFVMVDIKGRFEDTAPEASSQNVLLLSHLSKSQIQDREEPIKADEEMKESAGFDVAQFKADTLVNEKPSDAVVLSEDSLTLPALPSFHINGKDFVLVTHIQSLLKLREDYCLSIIAEGCDAAAGLIDVENEPFEEFSFLDTQTGDEEFTDASNALSLCIKKAEEEAPSLSDKLFEARLQELGIAEIGRGSSRSVEVENDTQSSINLWRDDLLEEDENLKIEIEDKDKFLGRAKGSRGDAAKSKDRALAHYLPKIDKNIFIVFHSAFSLAPDVPMFSLKVLSRFMGYSPLQFNASKIMLLEKTAALRIFGYGQGFWPSRAGYFLCYSAYALADKRKDVKAIGGYKRKTFLRYRGNMPEDSDRKRIKK